ncbi:MAG: hypothetical protein HY815_23575, partial [Candidatus Riflebacteria bacterium]|nr:hypothetical protein [Candidatus Riflebacteria bacterium]
SEQRALAEFPASRFLRPLFDSIVKARVAPLDQVLYLVQHLLYSDQDRAEALIRDLAAGRVKVLDEETAKNGTSDYFARSVQLNWPHGAVFMYETNIALFKDGTPDINAAVYRMGEPVRKHVPLEIRGDRPLRIDGLHAIKSEVLLLAGTLDHVAPVGEIQKARDALPRSRLVVFKGYHCLGEMKPIRNRATGLFYKGGLDSPELVKFLKSPACKSTFVEIR